MKIFLDDFIVYSDMEIHLWKFRLCFQNCNEYNNNLDSEKCAFMVFFGIILGYIVSKEGKLPNPKKIHAIMNMHVPHNSQQTQNIQWYGAILQMFY